MIRRSLSVFRRRLFCTLAAFGLSCAVGAQTPQVGNAPPSGGGPDVSTPGAPTRLRSASTSSATGAPKEQATAPARAGTSDANAQPVTGSYVPGEFEAYVQKLTGQPIDAAPVRRFGADLITQPASGGPEPLDYNPQIPQDYLVQPGDEVLVTLWGSVDADLRLSVDRAGRISIPRVGVVLVAGTRHADLADVIGRRVAQVFKNFQVSASVGQVRGIRVYVAGYVSRPGSLTVSSLSTLVNALIRSGGPSAAGSFRDIQLRRGRSLVTTFDLYDLLLKGDRSADHTMQADDVIFVGPVGSQVAAIGSVNQPAIFELKAGETLGDLLRMAGGLSTVADQSRVAIERLDDRHANRIAQIDLPDGLGTVLRNGDVLRAFNATSVALPVQRQNKRVRVEGEVTRPGEFVLPPRSTVADALRAAGGLTAAAYVYGTEFSRESVRVTQMENYERALRDLETEFARSTSTQRTSTADEAAANTARANATSRLVERLRAIKPSGRVVLQLNPESNDLPEFALEDGDRLYVPPRPTTVGVFGSVFNAGSYLHSTNRSIEDYLGLAGGPTRGADETSVFVIRANGSVVSSPQGKGWFGGRKDLAMIRAEPGDTVFVPEEINKTTFIQNAKDWTQILLNFGVGLAGIKSALN